MSDRFDRSSPLNSRRTTNDNYHDNSKIPSSQSAARINKNHRRHSTNAYTAAGSTSVSHKELSPSGSLNAASNYYEHTKNYKDGNGGGSGSSSSNNSNNRSTQKTRNEVKRKKTTSHLDHSNNSLNSNASTIGGTATTGQVKNGNNNANYLGKTIKMTSASSR